MYFPDDFARLTALSARIHQFVVRWTHRNWPEPPQTERALASEAAARARSGIVMPSASKTAPFDTIVERSLRGSYDSSHRRFDDGNVLLRRSAADSDAGDHLALACDRHAAAHRGVSTAG